MEIPTAPGSTRRIAFLRAINVGGHTVKMDLLRRLLESLDLHNVETFIASGNLVFDLSAPEADARLEDRIEARLESALGYPVAAFVRTPAEVRAALVLPFAGPDPQASGAVVYVGLLKSAPTAEAAARVALLQTPVDEFRFAGRELYWLCRKTISQSTVSGAKLERAFGGLMTIRNLTSLRRLAEKYAPA